MLRLAAWRYLKADLDAARVRAEDGRVLAGVEAAIGPLERGRSPVRGDTRAGPRAVGLCGGLPRALQGDDGVADRRRRFDGAALGHAAVALEEHALLDDHHGRLDVAKDPRRAPDLDALGAHDVTDDLAADRHDPGADRGVDDAFLTDDESVVRDDLAPEASVQHDGAGERELPLDLGTLVDERREVASLARGLRALPEEHRRCSARGG